MWFGVGNMLIDSTSRAETLGRADEAKRMAYGEAWPCGSTRPSLHRAERDRLGQGQ
jgi:hypothetical protein